MEITRSYSSDTMKIHLVMDDEKYKKYDWVSRYEEIKVMFNISVIDEDIFMSREIYQELTPNCVCDNPLPINNIEDVIFASVVNIDANEDFQDFFEEYELSKTDDCDCEDDCDCYLYIEDITGVEFKMELIDLSINGNQMREYMINEYRDISSYCRDKNELEDMLSNVISIRDEWMNQLDVSKDMANRIIPQEDFEEFCMLSTEIQREIDSLQSIIDKIAELNIKDNKIYHLYQRNGDWAVISDYDYIRDFRFKYMMEEIEEKDCFYNGKIHAVKVLEDDKYCEEITEIKIDGLDIDDCSVLDRYIKDECLVSGIVIVEEEEL